MKKYKVVVFLLMVGIFLNMGFIYSDFLLNSVSRSLVYKDKLLKSKAIVVLSGSHTGNRIETASKLFHNGFGNQLFFTGFKIYPEINTSYLMKKYALKLGVPENKIVTEISSGESSTRGESISNLKLLKKHNIKNFILVTSSYHTMRSRLIYQRSINLLGEEFEFSVFPAPDPSVPIQGWWKLRTGQNSIFLEYLKLIDYFLFQ